MRKGLLVILAAAAILIGMGVAFSLGSKEAEAPTNSTETNQSTSTDEQDSQTSGDNNTAPEGTTITYLDSGFSPVNYTARVGQPITIKNNSSRTLDFASDDHPVHTDNSELNVGDVSVGQSKTFKIDSPGDWGFHNHDFDAHSGTITVE